MPEDKLETSTAIKEAEDKLRKWLAERIKSIHQIQMCMDPGWREMNDFQLTNFCYSIADMIIEGDLKTKIDSLSDLLPLPTPPTVNGSSEFNNGFYKGFNECNQIIGTRIVSKTIELKKRIKKPEKPPQTMEEALLAGWIVPKKEGE